MINLNKIINNLLLEQSDKIEILKNSILNRQPISIFYTGPYPEVLSGNRINIEPIVMGTHIKSGNLVIWAYVFSGISKKGIPNWKMFRVDRIKSIRQNPNLKSFNLNDLPGYVKGKAPTAMKSLQSVYVYSPYLFDKKEPQKIVPEPKIKEPVTPEKEYPIEKPEISTKNYKMDVYNILIKPKIKNIDGKNIINSNDYTNALSDLYKKKEGEWINYQRKIGGNIHTGEGTRNRFKNESKKEIDDLLQKNRIEISDISDNLSETIYKRFKRLII